MRYVLLALCVAGALAVACGGGDSSSNEGLLQDVAIALTATQETGDSQGLARLGDTRELAFYPDGNFSSEPENMRITVLSVGIENVSPYPGVSEARPHLIVEALIENPTNGSGFRPDFEIVMPGGRTLYFYVGDYEGLLNLGSIFELPPRTQAHGAFYTDFQTEDVTPPDSLFGWRIVFETTGLVPLEGVRAVWEVD